MTALVVVARDEAQQVPMAMAWMLVCLLVPWLVFFVPAPGALRETAPVSGARRAGA